ncbi:MAG: hypothetical protein DRP93_02295 [Candidatus Neomarinimicrobiota bacterium]|nr:MAG: hypothetical protein DRP93_02295 [Candidatus Neomarinimicrobiota bacterium]
MKSKQTIMAVVATLIMVCMMTLSVASYTDGGNATMKVVPSSIDRIVGDEFSIAIVIEPDDAEVYSAQYALGFDPEILEALSQKEGDFLNEAGAANTIEVKNEIDNEAGKLGYGVTRMGVTTGVTVAGTLSQITFRVIGGDRGSHLDLTDVVVGDTMAKAIPVLVEDGVCLVDGKPPYVTPTPADAVIALQMAVRGDYSEDADVNRDSTVTSLDALMILQAAAGRIEL